MNPILLSSSMSVLWRFVTRHFDEVVRLGSKEQKYKRREKWCFPSSEENDNSSSYEVHTDASLSVLNEAASHETTVDGPIICQKYEPISDSITTLETGVSHPKEEVIEMLCNDLRTHELEHPALDCNLDSNVSITSESIYSDVSNVEDIVDILSEYFESDLIQEPIVESVSSGSQCEEWLLHILNLAKEKRLASGTSTCDSDAQEQHTNLDCVDGSDSCQQRLQIIDEKTIEQRHFESPSATIDNSLTEPTADNNCHACCSGTDCDSHKDVISTEVQSTDADIGLDEGHCHQICDNVNLKTFNPDFDILKHSFNWKLLSSSSINLHVLKVEPGALNDNTESSCLNPPETIMDMQFAEDNKSFAIDTCSILK